MWPRPGFLDHASREMLWKGSAGWALASFGENRIKMCTSCSKRNTAQQPLRRTSEGKCCLPYLLSGLVCPQHRTKLGSPGCKSFSFPILAAKAEMPTNAGNCDYTHFIFYILKPQGISSGEQSPISSIAAEQIPHSSCAERGWALAWGETDKDLTDSAGLCVPSWHLQRPRLAFLIHFLFLF